MFADRYLSNYAINWIKTKLIRKIGLKLCKHSARTPKFFRCAAGYHWPRHLRAVFALASDGALTLYVHYRAPNQYHESFKTNSYVKFSKESIAILIFQIKRAPFGENRNCLFKMLTTFWYINNSVFCLHIFKVQAFCVFQKKNCLDPINSFWVIALVKEFAIFF